MVHKIEESLKLAKKGIETHIVNGSIDNVLESIVLNGEGSGTLVTSK